MLIREALLSDIEQIQFVRNAVKENRLSNPALVPDSDVADYIQNRGKGWVCVEDEKVVGFAIADLKDHNIWALFLLPEYERRGIGRALHDTMMNWYFEQTDHPVWLSTAPGTRAEQFYRKSGWKDSGTYGKGEVLFKLTKEEWTSRT